MGHQGSRVVTGSPTDTPTEDRIGRSCRCITSNLKAQSLRKDTRLQQFLSALSRIYSKKMAALSLNPYGSPLTSRGGCEHSRESTEE